MIFFDFNDKIILEKEKVPAREEDNEYDATDDEEDEDTGEEEDLEADEGEDEEELGPPTVPANNDIGGETDYTADTDDDPDYSADVEDDDTEDDTEGEDDTADDDTDNQDDNTDDTGEDDTTNDEGDTPEDDTEGEDNTDDGGDVPEDDEGETDYTDDVEDDGTDTDTSDEEDTTDDTDDTGEEGEEDELTSLEKNVYSGLSQNDMKGRTNELKNNFLDLYKNVVLIQERLQKISKSTINAQVVGFIENKTAEIRAILYDYLLDTFNSNSYTENEKNYLTYIALFNNINKLFEQIYPNTDPNK